MSTCGTCSRTKTHLDEPLTGPYFTVDGSPQCMKCYQLALPECLACRKRIDGEYLMAFEATYHRECFKCYECACVIGKLAFPSFENAQFGYLPQRALTTRGTGR